MSSALTDRPVSALTRLSASVRQPTHRQTVVAVPVLLLLLLLLPVPVILGKTLVVAVLGRGLLDVLEVDLAELEVDVVVVILSEA
jgi:hypothetical protein